MAKKSKPLCPRCGRAPQEINGFCRDCLAERTAALDWARIHLTTKESTR